MKDEDLPMATDSTPTAIAGYPCCVLSTTTKFEHKQGDCSAPSLVVQGPMVPEHVSEFARAVPLTYTPLLIPPHPMMRTRS